MCAPKQEPVNYNIKKMVVLPVLWNRNFYVCLNNKLLVGHPYTDKIDFNISQLCVVNVLVQSYNDLRILVCSTVCFVSYASSNFNQKTCKIAMLFY